MVTEILLIFDVVLSDVSPSMLTFGFRTKISNEFTALSAFIGWRASSSSLFVCCLYYRICPLRIHIDGERIVLQVAWPEK